MTHKQRLIAARAFRDDVLAERTNLRKQLAERDSLITELRSNMTALQVRFEALKSMTLWAELASGATVHVGDTVRYMLHNYVCIREHTKTLLRAPTNGEYWQLVEE